MGKQSNELDLIELRDLLQHFVDTLPIKATEIGWEKVGEYQQDFEHQLVAWRDSHTEKKVREAQKQILRGFRRHDFVRDDFYETAVIERLAQLNLENKEKKK